MTWLLWKDFRLARPIFVVTLLLLVVPHAIALTLTGLRHQTLWTGLLPTLLFDSARDGLLLFSPLPLLLWGGLALAGERSDRSAEFLACQPVSRGRILFSKLLVTFGLIALMWLPNLAICVWLGYWRPGDVRTLGAIGLLGLTLFSTGWLFSSWLKSPVFAALAGLLAPLLLAMGVAIPLAHLGPWPGDWSVAALLLWPSLTVASFVGGTVHYLRRVEP